MSSTVIIPITFHWPSTLCLMPSLLPLRLCAAHLCPAICNPMDCGSPGSSAHGILQAGILEWVTFPFSGVSSQPRDRTCISCIAGRFFTSWATRGAPLLSSASLNSRIQSLQPFSVTALSSHLSLAFLDELRPSAFKPIPECRWLHLNYSQPCHLGSLAPLLHLGKFQLCSSSPKVIKYSMTSYHILYPILQLILPSKLSRRELTLTTATATILIQATKYLQ